MIQPIPAILDLSLEQRFPLRRLNEQLFVLL
jgi:hypothetical protein